MAATSRSRASIHGQWRSAQFRTAASSTNRKRSLDDVERRIERHLTALKRMFDLAIQAVKLLQKPNIPFLKEDNVRVGFFERDQFLAVRFTADAVCASRAQRRRDSAAQPRLRRGHEFRGPIDPAGRTSS